MAIAATYTIYTFFYINKSVLKMGIDIFSLYGFIVGITFHSALSLEGFQFIWTTRSLNKYALDEKNTMQFISTLHI